MKKTGTFVPKTQFFPLKTQCTAGCRPAKKCTNKKPVVLSSSNLSNHVKCVTSGIVPLHVLVCRNLRICLGIQSSAFRSHFRRFFPVAHRNGCRPKGPPWKLSCPSTSPYPVGHCCRVSWLHTWKQSKPSSSNAKIVFVSRNFWPQITKMGMKWTTTLQSMMYAKLSQQSYWHCHEKALLVIQ